MKSCLVSAEVKNPVDMEHIKLDCRDITTEMVILLGIE